MKVFDVRNVHEVLPLAINYLQNNGTYEISRNGIVMKSKTPVSTVYHFPQERLSFWEGRDINTAFLLYEALWMIAGRNTLAPLTRYVKNFGQYSDDGVTLNGAYGHRWRHHFNQDQIHTIIGMLKADPTTRRAVLQMWDANEDLGSSSKDLPCNMIVTFQVSNNALNMVVFCRSNDILWGAYFANAFHFSFLLEYMAMCIGKDIGTYTQISVNWHGYTETMKEHWTLGKKSEKVSSWNPYVAQVKPISFGKNADQWHANLDDLLRIVDDGFPGSDFKFTDPFFIVAEKVLFAHHVATSSDDPDRFFRALQIVTGTQVDLLCSMEKWLKARIDKGEK